MRKGFADEQYKKSFKVTKKQYGRANASAVKKLQKIADKVEALEEKFVDLTDDQLAEQTQAFRTRYAAGETLDDLLPEAYAVCREAAKRVLHQRHYYVQLLGGISLHQGRICQMATGEGKTLTETLPAYLNAIAGKGVHIVTVNEYLAVRDMEWMGKIFRFLGLTVGVTLNQMSGEQKRQAYLCDITYGTNNEFGFDYLRDNMATSRQERVQRGLNFVIVDEVDSILIDEARTPLIISGPSGKSKDMYLKANKFVCTLQKSTNVDEEGKTSDKDEQPNGHYVVDQKGKNVRLTDTGIAKAEKFFGLNNLSDPENMELNHYINNALRAHAIMHRDEDYIVERGEVVIVDSFTGRKMEGRRFSDGLHQAIEAKEHVTVKEENKTLATITFQNYFRMYHKMSGMTGTAKTEEKEFNTIYNIDVVAIPTHMPLIRQDHNDRFYATRQDKINAIVKEIVKRHAKGQPLLIGTVTVEKSEMLSELLKKEKIRHNVLNAKFHRREAEIVAQAGRFGSVTIATNMAGRGTDILLGGNAEFLAKQEMKRLGYEDEEIERSASFVKGDVETAELQQLYAQLLEKYRKQTEEERQKVLAVGGLCIIGTERHDSRRIDDQLRGRAGRQGDPGESIFFISAEDDIIRIFGGDLIQRTMLLAGSNGENPVFQYKIVNKIVASAQKRIEGRHFSARKSVLQYDDVNNQQRKVIYRERNRVLDGENVHEEILSMANDYARAALEDACDAEEDVSKWNLEEVNKRLEKYFPVESPIITEATSARQVCDQLAQLCKDTLQQRSTQEHFDEFERIALLRTTDALWMDHIDALNELRQGVGFQSIGQHDPLDVYKKEAFSMFEKLNEQIEVQTIRVLFFGKLLEISAPVQQPSEDINPEKKLNGPCPCGSGKKYKNCCYPKDRAKQQQQSQPDEEPHPLSKKEEYALKRQQRKKDKQNQQKG